MVLLLALQSQQISCPAHPLKPNRALYQAQSPRTWRRRAKKAKGMVPFLALTLSLSAQGEPSCRCAGHRPANKAFMLHCTTSITASSVQRPPHPHLHKWVFSMQVIKYRSASGWLATFQENTFDCARALVGDPIPMHSYGNGALWIHVSVLGTESVLGVVEARVWGKGA